MIDPTSNLTEFILAAGALGTAASGLVELIKPCSISKVGMGVLKAQIGPYVGEGALSDGNSLTSLPGGIKCFEILKANWTNGASKADQKIKSKSLIDLVVTSSVANATKVEGALGLSGISSSPPVLDQFDKLMNLIVDGAYEDADKEYRAWAKWSASLIALIMSIFTCGLAYGWEQFSEHWGSAVLAGLLAVPLAPIAKDLSTTITAAAQAIKPAKAGA